MELGKKLIPIVCWAVSVGVGVAQAGKSVFIISKHSPSQALGGLQRMLLGWLRLNTHTGRPLGSDSFLSKLEKLLGRRVRPLPVGRPARKRTKKFR